MAKIEEHVLTIEQIRHLKELGVEVKDTALCWYEGEVLPSSEFFEEDLNYVSDVTFTLQEILKILPKKFSSNGIEYEFRMDYLELYGYKLTYIIKQRSIFDNVVFINENPLECAYDMLCWVSENYAKEIFDYLTKEI